MWTPYTPSGQKGRAGVESALDEAEGVTRWVEVDAEVALLRGLVLVHPCAELEDARLGGIDGRDAQVQVELLRVCATGPGRGDVVVPQLVAEQGAVEATELEGVWAVQDDEVELGGDVHGRTVATIADGSRPVAAINGAAPGDRWDR